MTVEDNVFQDIIDGKIPAEILAKCPRCIIIRDKNPKAFHHYLVISTHNVETLGEINDEYDLGFIFHFIADFVSSFDLKDYRLIINSGPSAGQTIPRLHIHILAPEEGQVLPDF